ncbi:MAG: group II intron reverse transcriptase/maturase, partial [Cyanobacteria bacterium J06582_2]
MELGKSSINEKGKMQVRETLTRSKTNAILDGGHICSSDEDSVMELERRDVGEQLELPFTTCESRRIKGDSARRLPISKKEVYEAFKKVKRNGGSYGIDFQSIEAYEEDLGNNLYILWNRLSSGSYFPSPLREKQIPKKDGKMRSLGIPTVTDRIAQQVIKDYIEPRFEEIFDDRSYGYRPKRSAHEALQKVRENTWKQDWVLDMDIKSFFDEMSHELLLKGLERIVSENWIKQYIIRWLESAMLLENGELKQKEGKGTPQGGVISPLLANLFLHYAFDKWMEKEHVGVRFVRYADDIIVHCEHKAEADYVLKSIKARLQECGLELNERKTQCVFCKKDNKRSSFKQVSFDFLGYTFQPRSNRAKTGQMRLGYDCAISKSSQSKIAKQIRSYGFHKWTNRRIEEIADFFNPMIRGWLNYFGKFCKRKLGRIFKIFNKRLKNWARNRYKRLKKSYIKACKWLDDFQKLHPDLFVHWRVGFQNS